MKKINNIILGFILLLAISSCEEPERIASFDDLEQFSMYDYMLENEEKYSSFLSILEKGKLDNTLASYNPDGQDYTLFLPDNEAINNFISLSNQVSSLDDILNNEEFAEEFCRYHVINLGIRSGDFPFGAFPEPTLSSDYLTVSFIIEEDTSYYKINNQASVTETDIEVSNGYIHLIETALIPVNLSTNEWLEINNEYSIFKDAVALTGFDIPLSINTKESDTIQPITLLLESNEIYNQFNIFSVDDLISEISPDDNDYTSPTNPLYNFVGYHVLNGIYFIDDFEGTHTNYTTLSEVPQNIDGTGIDFAINRGKEIFDTIVDQGDTSYVDYVGFLYDESNVLTQSGAIHMLNRLLKQQSPSRATVNFQFYEEPIFNQYRAKEGSYLIDEDENLAAIDWKGPDLYFVDLGSQESSAWDADYLEMDGDFEITYQIPKIVQGKYKMFLGVEMYNSSNATIEVFVDGKKVGGFIDLTRGGTPNSPFQRDEIGIVDFKNYQSHKIEIKSLIPGRFLWDYIRFEPN